MNFLYRLHVWSHLLISMTKRYRPFSLKRLSIHKCYNNADRRFTKRQVNLQDQQLLSKTTISCLCVGPWRYTERCQGHGSLGISEADSPAAATRTSKFTAIFFNGRGTNLMVKIWSFDFTETLLDVLMARKTELNRTRKCPYVGVVFDNVIAL